MLLLNKQVVSKLLHHHHYSKKCNNTNNITQVLLNHQFGPTTTTTTTINTTIRKYHSNFVVSKDLKSIIAEYKLALSILEKYEQDVIEKDVVAPRHNNNNNTQESSVTFSSLETKLGKNQVVKLNIGGEKYFTTSLTTLKSIPNTFFTGYFNEQFNPPQPQSTDNAYFIDRPSKHFELILSYLRGINIKEKIEMLSNHDLNEFIEEVAYYQITPIYDLLPPKGRKQLETQYGIALEKSGDENASRIVKFDPNYCSSKIILESETRARCNENLDGCSVLGTISNSYKVKLISNCTDLMIGFAPKSIDVNNSYNSQKCGYYLFCYNGYLYSQNGDYEKSYIDCEINDGSIVECLLDKENGTISYKVDGKDYGVAYSNIPNPGELYPAFEPSVEDGGKACTIELLNE